MKLTLTSTEGFAVIDALRNYALKRGWTNEEIKESDILAEYAGALDAAMCTLGLELVVIPTKESEESDSEEDFDLDVDDDDEEEDYFDCDDEDGEDEMESLIWEQNGLRTISKEDADLLVECITNTLCKKFPQFPAKVLTALVQVEALHIAESYGIEAVDMGE